jgi:hypothetical protein
MTEFITLLGAEEVSSAADIIRSAAEDINRAASQIEDTSFRFLRQFEELVQRLENLKENNPQ